MTSLRGALPTHDFDQATQLPAENQSDEVIRKWYAVYTMPRGERSVAKYLDLFEIDSFLPTCQSTHIWKNRQRAIVIEPLFPSYLFARIRTTERSIVLRAPAALRLVGNCQGPSHISDSEIEFLRSDFCRHRVEPYSDLAIGKKVRIRDGAMRGVQGVLVQKKNNLRFVLTIKMINQCAAVEVTADELEAVLD